MRWPCWPASLLASEPVLLDRPAGDEPGTGGVGLWVNLELAGAGEEGSGAEATLSWRAAAASFIERRCRAWTRSCSARRASADSAVRWYWRLVGCWSTASPSRRRAW